MTYVEKILKLTFNLERLIKTVHLANLSFMSKALGCQFCGERIFKFTINLERHMIIVHLANLSIMSKALGCDFCRMNIQSNNQFRMTYENFSFG